jgi:PTS system beta-glucosides-specific IIC component
LDPAFFILFFGGFPMKDYAKSAKAIIQAIGGEKNVARLIHCSTRLRFTLKDPDTVDFKALKAVPGVIGAVNTAGQCQVVIGNDVIEMYDAVMAELGDALDGAAADATPKAKQKWYQVLLDFIIAIFQPLVPAIAGGGILKSLLMLVAMFGWMSDKSSTYQLLNFIGTAPLYFLPILVAITTAQKLRVNILVAVSIVSALVLPDMTAALGKGITLFSLPVQNITYASQVFPAILCVLFYSVMEKYLTKYSPKAIRIFFVPLVSMAVTVPVTLLLLGPAGYTFGQGFSAVILFLFNHFGWIATALLATVLPLMVATGMHKAMIPYAVSSMSSIGKELLYLPASLAHNISESGVCFGIAIRTKDKTIRATAISAGISALFGITEPALYGITLQNKRALTSVMISSFVGGAFVGIVGLQGFALVGPGLASLTLFVDKANPMNLIYALIGFGISLVLSFVLSLFLWQDAPAPQAENEVAPADPTLPSVETITGGTVTPVAGEQVALDQVNDDIFASGVMGEGLAIIPNNGELVAPAPGKIIMVADTEHAIGLRTNTGKELMFHVGIDTVKLQGQYFHALVKEGDAVKAGQPLLEFDLDRIIEAGYDPTVMVIDTTQPETAHALGTNMA